MPARSLVDFKLTAAAQRVAKVSDSGWRVLCAQPAIRWAQGVEIAAVVALAVLSADLVLSLAGASTSPAAPTQLAGVARSAPSFDASIFSSLDPFHRVASAAGGKAALMQAPETMLDLQLFGIRAGENGSAIIAGPDKLQQTYTVGQEILPGVRLERVTAGGVIIRRNGVAESVSLDKDRQPPVLPATVTPAPAGDDWRIVSSDVVTLLASVKLGARAEGGVVLLEGAPLAQLGMQQGDILVAVNGTPVRDAASLMAVANTWRGAERLSLEVERGGQRKIHKFAVDR